MEWGLTRGAVQALLEDLPGEKPILQILDIRTVIDKERYRIQMLISDGIRSYGYAFLASDKSILYLSGALPKLSIIRADEVISTEAEGRRLLVFMKLTVIAKGTIVGRIIGNPVRHRRSDPNGIHPVSREFLCKYEDILEEGVCFMYERRMQEWMKECSSSLYVRKVFIKYCMMMENEIIKFVEKVYAETLRNVKTAMLSANFEHVSSTPQKMTAPPSNEKLLTKQASGKYVSEAESLSAKATSSKSIRRLKAEEGTSSCVGSLQLNYSELERFIARIGTAFAQIRERICQAGSNEDESKDKFKQDLKVLLDKEIRSIMNGFVRKWNLLDDRKEPFNASNFSKSADALKESLIDCISKCYQVNFSYCWETVTRAPNTNLVDSDQPAVESIDIEKRDFLQKMRTSLYMITDNKIMSTTRSKRRVIFDKEIPK